MNLFAGSDATESQQRPPDAQEKVISINLRTPEPEPEPAENPLPEPPDTSSEADNNTQKQEPSAPPPQVLPQPEVVTNPAEKTQTPTPKSGLMDCESLTAKPRRIELGNGQLNADLKSAAGDGSVVLHISVRKDGTVLGVTVERSTLDRKLEGAIVDYAYRSLFTPGELDGVPVDCDMKYEIVPERVKPSNP